jgi:hypothetical protein
MEGDFHKVFMGTGGQSFKLTQYRSHKGNKSTYSMSMKHTTKSKIKTRSNLMVYFIYIYTTPIH